MGLSNSPKISTDGLIFAYELNNIKSYKGPPLTNKTQYLNTYNFSGTGYSFVGDTEEAYIPSLGRTTVKTVKIQNNYPSVSDWCCPAPVQHADGFVVSPSTVYTYFILYKIESGYTNANYMYRYEFTSSGGSYVTEQGVHSDSNRTYLGDGWYYAWGTFTTNASTNWIGFCGSFYYRYSTSYDKFWVAKSAIIEGNWSGMHPKYWPSPGETRSNTQALRDLTGQNTITVSGLTYNNDETFTIAGESNYISITNSSILRPSTELTIEYIIKGSAPVGWTPILGYGNGDYTNGNYLVWVETGGALNSLCRINNGGVTEYRQYPGYSISSSNFQHMCFTMKIGDAIRSYRNGVDTNTPTILPSGGSFYYGGTSSPYQVGGSGGAWLNATVPLVRLYNRALSANEVSQNFVSQRGKYGI